LIKTESAKNFNMVIDMNGNAENGPMILPATLDLAAAEGLLESVRQRVSDERPLFIDASAVEMLTLPCAQVILAARWSHGGVTIKNPSTAFTAALEDLGINWAWDVGRGQEQGEDQSQSHGEEIAQQDTSVGGQNGTVNGEQWAADNGEMQNESGNSDLQEMGESAMGKRILTIDDSKTMRDMLMLTLAEAGFDVLQAVDGQDGLDVLVNEQVDVVITDINMPRMDGYEVIRQLRSNPSHKTMPILVLTTESEAEKKNLAREAGATGWMVKPFDPDRLVATVRKVAP
jgi:two-component system chemotaxis response regulator CheY